MLADTDALAVLLLAALALAGPPVAECLLALKARVSLAFARTCPSPEP